MPFFISLSAKVKFLANESINPITNSATALIADSGEFTTSTLFCKADPISILSSPTPTLPIILAFVAFEITSLVILVLLLTTITS